MSTGCEKKLRRKEFARGTALRLPDGQVWWFYEPGAAPGGWDWGAVAEEEADHLTETLKKLVKRLAEAKTLDERVTGVVWIAWLFLARNYTINPNRFDRILAAHGPIPRPLWARLERFVVDLGERVLT